MKLGKKIIAALLAGSMLLSGGMSAMATDTQDQPTDNSAEQNAGTSTDQGTDPAADTSAGYKVDPVTIATTKMPETEEEIEAQMAAQLAIKPESNSIENWPQGPDVTADSAVVMEVNSGAILYSKQMDKKQYPASITKIMTALLALENGDLNTDRVTFSEDSINFLEYGDAHIGMQAGEEISLNDAMYGMLLASANEVSYAIAENIGNKLGVGYNGFIQRMTMRAQELGCENTNFVNANGLHDSNHYISAKDMATISAEAYKHEAFRNIIKTGQYTIPETNLVSEKRTFQQNHKMIYEGNQYYYDACTGGKTGYTDQARTTLVSYAEKNGMQLVCVVLRTRGGVAYTDTKALFEYAFNNFQKVPLKNVETSKDFSEIPDDAYVILPNNVSAEEMMEKVERTVTESEEDAKIANVNYTYGDVQLGKAALTFSEAYLLKQQKAAEKTDGKAEKAEEKKEGFPLWGKIVIGLLIFVVLAGAALYIYLWREKEKRRRRNMKRRRAKQLEMERERQREEERRARQEYQNRTGRMSGTIYYGTRPYSGGKQDYSNVRSNYSGARPYSGERTDYSAERQRNYEMYASHGYNSRENVREQYRNRYDRNRPTNQNHYTRNRKG